MNSFRQFSIAFVASAIAVPVPAAAQEIEEIIVTAAKREQSLQDVAIAVTAVTGDELAANQIASLEDLQFLIPNMTFGNDFNFAKLYIRGLGFNSSFHGVDPSVALHVDGAVVAQVSAQFASLYDLERVEVLRGPQSTLYGRNNTGGTVNLITRAPADKSEGYVRLTAGGDDLNLIGEGAVSFPLSETVLSRLSFRVQERDGYGLNESTGQDIDNARQRSARAQIHFIPSGNFDFRLIGEWYEEDDNAYLQKFLAPSFVDDPVLGPVPPNFVSLGTTAPSGLSSNPRNIRSGPTWEPVNYKKTWYFSGLLNWSLNDTTTVRSISNYRELTTVLGHDFTMSDFAHAALPFPPGQTSAIHDLEVRQWQWSEELQVVYDADRFHAIFGLYYLKEDVRGDNRIGHDPFNVADDLLQRVVLDGDLRVEASALFANLIFDVTDQVSLRVAGRYSDEDRDLINEFRVAPPNSPTNLPNAAPPSPNTEAMPFDIITGSWDDFSPEVGIDYKPSDNILTYFTYSEGFKSGNAEIGQNNPSFVEPEEVESYELGLKSNLANNTVQLNVSAFYYEMINGQFNKTIPIPQPPFFVSTLENAAAQDGKGIEIDALFRPSDELQIRVATTYLDAEFTSFMSLNPIDARVPFVPSDQIPQTELAGNRPRNSPEWQGNLYVSYDQPLGNGATLTWAGNVSYKGSQFFNEFSDPRVGADSYTMLDGFLRYTSSSGKMTVDLWGKNLTDELIAAGAFPISTSRTISGQWLPPRRYGVTATFNFE